MNEKKKKVIDQIVKLLRLAENNDNDYQSRSARKKVAELMRAYNIEESELSSVDDNEITHKVYTGGFQRIPTWLITISVGVALFLGCRTYTVMGKRFILLVGRRIDTEALAYLIDSVVAQTKVLAAEYRRERILVTRKQMEAFRIGIGLGLYERASDLVKSLVDYDSETALVVRDKGEAAHEYATEEFSLTGDVTDLGLSKIDPEARRAGIEASKSINVHRAIQ